MKTSVVITAYNIEKYIEKAIKSCLQEGVGEVIVVEDKSTDNTLNIIKEIIKNNVTDVPIVLLENEENLGAGMSRRIGIKACKEEYIITIDGDDYVDKGYFKTLLDRAEETDADIVSSGVKIIQPDGTWTAESYGTKITEGYDKVVKYWGQRIVFMNNKIIRRKLFDNIEYSSRRYIEDTPTIIPLLWYANKVAYIDFLGYNYVLRYESLTHSSNDFKEMLYKGLCWLDLMDFFLDKDPDMFKHIAIPEYVKTTITQLNSIIALNKEIIGPYKEDWIEFTYRFINRVSISQINFKNANNKVSKRK